jgi:hypothetical protein
MQLWKYATGDDITKLMSMQMVKKILNGLNEGLYQIKFENN